MGRLIHNTRDAFLDVAVVTCLAVGAVGAVYFTVGPEGWLTDLVRALLRDPNLATLAALAAAIGALALFKRILDSNLNSSLNNLLAGAVALGGFAILLQGIRALFA